MKIDYPVEEFFAHQEAWNERFWNATSVTLGGHVVPIGNDTSTDAGILRTVTMMFSMGIRDEGEARKKGKAFTLVQMYLRTHADALRRGGLIRLNDDEMAVVTPQGLQAIQEAFLDDPPADPLLVTVDSVIARGQELLQQSRG